MAEKSTLDWAAEQLKNLLDFVIPAEISCTAPTARPIRNTFLLLRSAFSSETRIRVASQGSAPLGAQETRLSVARDDAAGGDAGEHGDEACVRPRPSCLPAARSRGPVSTLRSVRVMGEMPGLWGLKDPEVLLRAAGASLPDLVK